MSSSETPIQQLAEAARSMQEKDSTVEMLDEAVGPCFDALRLHEVVLAPQPRDR